MKDPNDDLQIMINYVINASNVEIIDGTKSYKVWRRRGWWWTRQKKYYHKWWVDRKQSPRCPADPIFLDNKFRIKTQVWPPTHWADWLQDIYTTFPFSGPHHQMIIPEKVRNWYKRTALRDGPHDRDIRQVTYDYLGNKSWSGYWSDSKWWTDQKNMKFLQKYGSDRGKLADTTPTFAHGVTRADGISERLTIGNDKFAFSIELDKDGNNFIYDLFDIGGGSLFDKPISVELSKKHLDEKGDEVPSFPWWHERKRTTSNGQIQKDEFLKRFVGADHPLRRYSGWGSIGNKLWSDLHLNFYQVEVQNTIVEPLRRGPMKSFWLEELYRAKDWEELSEIAGEELVRNRVFDPTDPYVKCSDIRQQAGEILHDE
jgi:hypothetical protein